MRHIEISAISTGFTLYAVVEEEGLEKHFEADINPLDAMPVLGMDPDYLPLDWDYADLDDKNKWKLFEAFKDAFKEVSVKVQSY